MAVQFAGSSSTGARRRRRLVVNGDGTGIETSLPDGDAAEMESQLVASEAAGPWVPANETRIWIGAVVVGLLLGGLTFALARPDLFHAKIAPVTNHLLVGPRPILATGVQSLFLALSAQLGMLISWYRARCRLDFGGRYRVWPWATGLFAIAAFCMATGTHRPFGEAIHLNRPFGEAIHQSPWVFGRGATIAWLLPFCAIAFPIIVWLDRDMRNSRSSLYTFRISVLLGVVGVCLELFAPEIAAYSWYGFASLLTPLFASATMFVSLWHHARVVAYVCPDPPELDERTMWSVITESARWLGCRLMFCRRQSDSSTDDDSKPKRRRKKAEPEESATKRKRKAPVKRTTTRTRTRPKPNDEEESEESNEATDEEQTDSAEEQIESSSAASNSKWEDEQEQWEEESQSPPPKPSQPSKQKGNGRITLVDEAHSSSAPAPHSRRSQHAWDEEPKAEQESNSEDNSSSNESDEDRQFQLDSGMTADQMKGLSKRQKRDLKKQLRDQQRARGR